MKRILIIAAHPDDEVLGVGGTIAALAAKNDIFKNGAVFFWYITF